MRIHVVRGQADANSRLLLERNFRLRHQIFVEQQGWEDLRRPDGRDVDAYDTNLATHMMVTVDGELVGGSRFNSLATPNLLTGVFAHLLQTNLPGPLEDGVDWTRFYVRPDRRERRRRAPESAALFCAMMEYALAQGYAYVTFVSSIYMLEHGTAVGWRITPLGMPQLIDGKPTIAAWIEVSQAALANVRHATGMTQTFLPDLPLLETEPFEPFITQGDALGIHLDLMVAVLGHSDPEGQRSAQAMLDAALIAEADPIDFCIAAGLVSERDATKRLSSWLDLAWLHKLPLGATAFPQPARLEALAEVRAFRLKVLDRDVLFCAPNFFNAIQMRRALANDPRAARRICLVPASALRDYLTQAHAENLLDAARQRLVRLWPWATAQLELTLPARICFVAALVSATLLVLISPFMRYPVLMPLAALMILLPAALSVAALFVRAPKPGNAVRPDDAELPVYSVLIPLRDEAHMVPQLAKAMLALDYPRDRLDIKFVVEARSPATIAAARSQCRHGPFSVVEVPDAAPRTKPKAMAYALPLCRGEFVVVFDAEDTPHPTQLWRAALQFRARADLHCIQAPLVIDNMDDGVLATLFSGEYCGLFGLKLPALSAWDLPVPLGGTSNHFRTETLRKIGGWDPFNVTEDADLGVRLARRGLRVGMLSVPTFEEAPNRMRTWLAQRTRWMKGWMQTFIVHNRRPLSTLRDMGWRRFAAFEILTLGQIMAPILHSAFMAQGAIRLAFGIPILGDTGGWTLIYPLMFAFGYGAAIMQALVGTYRLGWRPNYLVQALLPLYWLLMSIATIRAVYELIERPFYWAKTPHRSVVRRGASVRRPLGVKSAPLRPAPGE